jgi:hypothetical protein
MTSLLLIAALGVQQETTLRYVFAKDQPVAFDVRRSFRELVDGYETAYIEEWKFTPQEMLAGGAAVIKVERSTNAIEVDGKVHKLTPTTHTETEKRSPRGDVRDRMPSHMVEPLFELRLRRIADFNFPTGPIKPGTKWQVDAAATEDGFPAATWVWSFDEIKDGQVKGIFTFAEKGIEQPIEATGNFTLSTKDGWPTELILKAINTHQPGDEERIPTLYTFSMKRK